MTGGSIRILTTNQPKRSVKHERVPLLEAFPMTGIQFVTDEEGRKVAVQIDLREHAELWEEIEDVLVSRSRRNEPSAPLSEVKSRLIKSGKLRA
jgi:hypothetical protein